MWEFSNIVSDFLILEISLYLKNSQKLKISNVKVLLPNKSTSSVLSQESYISSVTSKITYFFFVFI